MASNLKGSNVVINDNPKGLKEADLKGANVVINDNPKGRTPFLFGISLTLNENLKSGASFRVPTTTITSEASNIESSFCFCGGCDYEQSVFAFIGGEDYQNDKSSFLFSKKVPTDKIAFELYKNGSKVADLDDSTYGEYVASYTEQPLYTSFILYWEKVLLNPLFGVGIYTVKVQKTILGNSDTLESVKFNLRIYNDQLADGTLKIQAVHNGNHLSGFNYKNLVEGGWIEEYRLSGQIDSITPVSETDVYRSNDNKQYQIKARENKELVVSFNPLPFEAWERLLFIDVMATEKLLITDYNLIRNSSKKSDSFITYDLIKNEVEKEDYPQKSSFKITFGMRNENNVMSNF